MLKPGSSEWGLWCKKLVSSPAARRSARISHRQASSDAEQGLSSGKRKRGSESQTVNAGPSEVTMQRRKKHKIESHDKGSKKTKQARGRRGRIGWVRNRRVTNGQRSSGGICRCVLVKV
jgi:hypothetical protein